MWCMDRGDDAGIFSWLVNLTLMIWRPGGDVVNVTVSF